MLYLETTLADSLEEVVRVAKESFGEEEFTRSTIQKTLQDRKHWIYVAKEKEIVGFKIFYESDLGNKDLYNWLDAVSLEYRRKGIASTLMDMEISFARQNKYSGIRLNTNEEHPEMISLCKKFGFIEVDRRYSHLGRALDIEDISFRLAF